MGKKKNRGGGDDNDFREGDFSTKFVSAKQAAAMEAAEAERNEVFDEDVNANKSKQQRKRKGGAQELDDDFGDNAGGAEVKADVGDMDAQDLQNAMEENFEGIGKKNTRKKKNKEVNMNDFAAAFDEAADEDEIHAKKGGKNQKKHQRKGKQKRDDSEQEEDEQQQEETKEVVAQDPEEETEASSTGYPLQMVYCQQCGLPPEYCEFGQKDSSKCKDWLRDSHPLMYKEIYGALPDEQPEEEKKAATAEGEGEEAKPKKKVKFGKNPDDIGVITVYKQKRGGRKVISQIVGFEHYTKDLKSLASKFGKKFSCGSNLATDEIHGECISVQGDVEDRLLEILEQDKDLEKLGVPFEKIRFVEDGNKKGRKRPGPAKPSE